MVQGCMSRYGRKGFGANVLKMPVSNPMTDEFETDCLAFI